MLYFMGDFTKQGGKVDQIGLRFNLSNNIKNIAVPFYHQLLICDGYIELAEVKYDHKLAIIVSYYMNKTKTFHP